MSSVKRTRIERLHRLAEGEQDRAETLVRAAANRLHAVDAQRAEALGGAAELADVALPLALRGHLAGVGSRHLMELAEQRVELAAALEAEREELLEATRRVRSFERLLERLDKATAERRRRREAAELTDLVAIRAARERVMS